MWSRTDLKYWSENVPRILRIRLEVFVIIRLVQQGGQVKAKQQHSLYGKLIWYGNRRF